MVASCVWGYVSDSALRKEKQLRQSLEFFTTPNQVTP
jgi:hypothetical protein